MSPSVRGALFGLLAAALFGASAPTAKILLRSLDPVTLAGLLYLGAAIGLWTYRALVPTSREAPLTSSDLRYLSVVIVAGGILGPIFMLFGLQRVEGMTGSLLLNLEAPFTLLLAVIFFGEHIGRAGMIAAASIMLGATMLKVESGTLAGDLPGFLLLGSACACWALDNNLTQRLSLKDPFAVVKRKTLVAGLTNTTLGLLASGRLPEVVPVLQALALGSLSYGLSVVLDVYALRAVGAAREAAYFATAPFAGALTAMILLGEHIGLLDAAAMGCMAFGVVMLLRERHAHEHQHDAMDHEHAHMHDLHHQHTHRPDDPPGEPHSHVHHHPSMVHDHPHVSDAHHRHRH